MKLTDSQKRIYDVLNRTNLTDRDKAILISQLQEKLVSGENISTINGEDITKGGNIEIQTGSDVVFKGNYDAENNPAATIQDVKDEISEVEPYVINLTNLLAAQDSESIAAVIGGIDNLNGIIQENKVIFGTLANGTVAVGIRVLGNQTTLTYFVDSVVGLTVNEIIITNTDGTLTKTANTHSVITENMVINFLTSDETTLPLSAAQGKALKALIDNIDVSEDIKEAINALDVSEVSAEIGKIISSVSQIDGKVNVKIRAIVEGDIPELPQSKITDLSTDFAAKQNATDNNLATTAKTIVGAINEINEKVNNILAQVAAVKAATKPYEVTDITDAENV